MAALGSRALLLGMVLLLLAGCAMPAAVTPSRMADPDPAPGGDRFVVVYFQDVEGRGHRLVRDTWTGGCYLVISLIDRPLSTVSSAAITALSVPEAACTAKPAE